jgi:hypothetical protein
MVHIVDK